MNEIETKIELISQCMRYCEADKLDKKCILIPINSICDIQGLSVFKNPIEAFSLYLNNNLTSIGKTKELDAPKKQDQSLQTKELLNIDRNANTNEYVQAIIQDDKYFIPKNNLSNPYLLINNTSSIIPTQELIEINNYIVFLPTHIWNEQINIISGTIKVVRQDTNSNYDCFKSKPVIVFRYYLDSLIPSETCAIIDIKDIVYDFERRWTLFYNLIIKLLWNHSTLYRDVLYIVLDYVDEWLFNDTLRIKDQVDDVYSDGKNKKIKLSINYKCRKYERVEEELNEEFAVWNGLNQSNSDDNNMDTIESNPFSEFIGPEHSSTVMLGPEHSSTVILGPDQHDGFISLDHNQKQDKLRNNILNGIINESVRDKEINSKMYEFINGIQRINLYDTLISNALDNILNCNKHNLTYKKRYYES